MQLKSWLVYLWDALLIPPCGRNSLVLARVLSLLLVLWFLCALSLSSLFRPRPRIVAAFNEPDSNVADCWAQRLLPPLSRLEPEICAPAGVCAAPHLLAHCQLLLSCLARLQRAISMRSAPRR